MAFGSFFRNKIRENSRALNETEAVCRASVSQVRRDGFRVELLKNRVNNVKTAAKELQDSITNVKVQEVGGWWLSTFHISYHFILLSSSSGGYCQIT